MAEQTESGLLGGDLDLAAQAKARLRDLLAGQFRPILDAAAIALRIAPGNVEARQALVRLRAALEREAATAAGFDAPVYELVRQLGEVLDQDLAAVAGRSGRACLLDVGPARQDPVATMYRLGGVDDHALRGALEIRQVAEVMRDGGIGGVRAVDYARPKVQGGKPAHDLMTRTVGHRATSRVGAFFERLRREGQRWDVVGQGRQVTAADLVMAVVVDRVGCRALDRRLAVRDRTTSSVVAAALRAYADAARPDWTREDEADKRAGGQTSVEDRVVTRASGLGRGGVATDWASLLTGRPHSM